MSFFSKFKNFGKPSETEPKPAPPPIPGPKSNTMFKMPEKSGPTPIEPMIDEEEEIELDILPQAEKKPGARNDIEINLIQFGIDDLLKKLVEVDGSDLHLESGNPPVFRIKGDVNFSKMPDLTDEQLRSILLPLVSEREVKTFEKIGNLDFAYQIEGVARFRGNLLKQRMGVGAVFRVIPEKIPSLEQLNLPDVLRKISLTKSGIVLVTGPTGSGKSTTMAAMINFVNLNRKAHIITIEDPVEFTHTSQKCLIDHRQVGHHTRSFPEALKAALREDPDIVLVGEMRELETIALAITAAEMGVLVFGTLHTNSAAKTIDRIVDVFPPKAQDQVRSQLSQSLRGVVSQQLLKTADGKGRCAALEILVGSPGVSGLIREGKTGQIPSYIQMGKDEGMITMDTSLLTLFNSGKITKEAAFERSIDKHRMSGLLGVKMKDT